MTDCCKEYRQLEDVIIVYTDTVCGTTLQAIDLSTLLTTSELSLSPKYDILFSGGNYTENISINGSILEVELKVSDAISYEEVVIVSLVGDNYKYKVRVKIKFKDRCSGINCPQGEVCNPCTGDCETGEADAKISIEDPTGSSDLQISIQ